MWPAFISGILQGSVYVGVAVGLSLIFGVMKVVNFAHGSLMMLGMYAAYLSSAQFGMSPYVALLFSVPLMFVTGYLAEWYLINPLYRREQSYTIEPTSVLVLTLGLWLVLDNFVLFSVGSQFRYVSTDVSNTVLKSFGVRMPLTRVIAATGAMATVALLYFVLYRTPLGRAMRSTAQNREAAALSGIDVHRIYALTFGLGSAATALAGGLLLPFLYASPTVGFAFDIRAFLVVVLGGMGSIPGTVLAGLAMGVTEAIATQYVGDTIARMIFFLLFVGVLVVRPQGLFGRAES